jgi:uncharacterized membrane protein (UPF0127 family)
VEVARALGARLRGLLGRSGWGDRDGLLIDPCSSVHTLFLRFAIDVVFLDADDRIVAIERLARNRLGRIHARARRALELPGGTADRFLLRPGDQVRFSPTRQGAPDD